MSKMSLVVLILSLGILFSIVQVPGLAIDISDCLRITSPGDYLLTSDIVIPNNRYACLDINADDVTLDCQGKTITGGPVYAVGIFVANNRNVLIKNCNIIGLDGYGILINSSDSTVMLDKNTFCSNGLDINNHGIQSTGVENKCDKSTNWDDAGVSGCTYICSGCGDGSCDTGEDCSICPVDCGSCSTCGDGTCQTGETCTSCQFDCGVCTPVCGNHNIELGETCDVDQFGGKDCISEGFSGGNIKCTWVTCKLDISGCWKCGDGKCNEQYEDYTTCSADCPSPYCGDSKCQPSEDYLSCSLDCPVPNLRILQDHNLRYLHDGDTVVFEIRYMADQVLVEPVSVTHILPIEFEYVSDTSGSVVSVQTNGNNKEYTWELDMSGCGGYGFYPCMKSFSITYDFQTTLNHPRNFISSVSLSSGIQETNPKDNKAGRYLAFVPSLKDIGVHKSCPRFVESGEKFSYYVNIFQNAYKDPISDMVKVIEVLPEYVTYLSDTSGVTPTVTVAGGQQILEWTLPPSLFQCSNPVDPRDYYCWNSIQVFVETSSTALSGALLVARTDVDYFGTVYPAEEYFYNNKAVCNMNVKEKYSMSISKYSGDVRPGFDSNYGIYIRNYGTEPLTDIQIVDTLPPVSYIHLRSGYTGTYDSVTNTLTEMITKIEPGKEKYLRIPITIDAATPLGTLIRNCVDADSPQTSARNCVSFQVAGSYDPNEKYADPYNETLLGQPIYYTISFENIGTAETVFINVYDKLDENLDDSTFQLDQPEFDVFMNYDEEERMIHWYMPIALQPNETKSVVYTITPKQGLPFGTVIKNDATIVFDYNEAIVTNTVENTIVQCLSEEDCAISNILYYVIIIIIILAIAGYFAFKKKGSRKTRTRVVKKAVSKSKKRR
ncbi:MAG: right-handed parallel beta-helix repeat-containing protein [Candidatus Aenigmatarchaeota archaeon]